MSAAIAGGAHIIVLSDRGGAGAADAGLAPIPSLLLTGTVHHHLIRQRTRTRAGLIVEAGDARECHHIALLIGYGAAAVNPYLALQTVQDMVRRGLLDGVTAKKAAENTVKALGKGLLKIMSKMGVSTVASYTGAQIFEAIGLGQEIVSTCFTGTTSRLGGVGFEVLAAEAAARHTRAFPPRGAGPDHRRLETGGDYQWRREGEPHLFNPETVFKLQHATRSRRYEIFKEYTRLVDDQSARLMTLRGLLRIRGVDDPTDPRGLGAASLPARAPDVGSAPDGGARLTGERARREPGRAAPDGPAPVGRRAPSPTASRRRLRGAGRARRDASHPAAAPGPDPHRRGEPVSEIVRRFSTGAMSYGSISAEAHQTLAIAMNRLGGRSNTGEGGEDPDRFVPDANGDLRRSAVKQVASGRFGVTSEYLVNADDLQIKMAQGAKPGEGGQLPGHKVYPWIAKTRYSTPGVGPDLPAAAPRHLLHRGPGPADPRPEERQPAGPGARQAGRRGGGRHGRGRRVQGPRRRGADLRARRRHRRRPADQRQARGRAVGAGPGRDPADPAPGPAAGPDRGPGRRPAEDRPGRDHRRAARRRGVRLRERPAGRVGLHHDAGLPPGHLPGRGGHPEP